MDVSRQSRLMTQAYPRGVQYRRLNNASLGDSISQAWLR